MHKVDTSIQGVRWLLLSVGNLHVVISVPNPFFFFEWAKYVIDEYLEYRYVQTWSIVRNAPGTSAIYVRIRNPCERQQCGE